MLRAGGSLEFELSHTPTGWATASRPVSASQLHGFTAPPRDLLAPVPGTPTDDLGLAPAVLPEGASRTFPLLPGSVVRDGGIYTVSLAERGNVSWILEGLAADGGVVELDRRADEEFERHGQLRPFRVSAGAASDLSAVRFTALAPLTLVQLELLD
jgi:hypothetical protein